MSAATKISAAVLVAAVAACAEPPSGQGLPLRGFAFAPPPGCEMVTDAMGSECDFRTADGRDRKINIRQNPLRIEEAFADPAAVRAAGAANSRAFWETLVLGWESSGAAVVMPNEQVRRAEASIRDRRLGPSGAQACVQFVYDTMRRQTDGTWLAVDNEGVRCALYDPAADVVEEFLFEYEEFRSPSVPRAPGFSTDADRVIRSLSFAAPGASAAAALALAVAATSWTATALAEEWKSVAFARVSLQVPTWCRMVADDPVNVWCRREIGDSSEGISVWTRGQRATVDPPSPQQSQTNLEEYVLYVATGMLGRSSSRFSPIEREFSPVPSNALPRGADACVRGDATVAHTGFILEVRSLTCGALSADRTYRSNFHIEVVTDHRPGALPPFPDFENRATRIQRGAAFRTAM